MAQVKDTLGKELDLRKPDDFGDITAEPKKITAASAPYAVTGTVLKVSIVAESWDKPGDSKTLNCGSFEIDGFDWEYSSGGSVASIKACSIPLTSSARREEKNKAWEDVTLREICADIAGNAGLTLMYELDDDPHLDRVDQRRQSDLGFLDGLCKQLGVSTKVCDNRLVVFDEVKYEAQDAVFVFKRGDNRLLSARFTLDSSDTASSATVQYKDPSSGKKVEETFKPAVAPAVAHKLALKERALDMPRGGGGRG